MSQSNRLKEVRNYFGYTQKEFGEKIDVGQTYLSQLENGDRILTEKIIKLVCLQFGVNYSWLTEGKGEMLTETDDELLMNLSKKYDLRDVEISLIKEFIKLEKKDRDILLNYLYNVFGQKKDE